MPEYTCPACSSPDYFYIGTLGNMDWFRCADCGTEFSAEHDQNEAHDEPPAEAEDEC
jgi:rubredoxin